MNTAQLAEFASNNIWLVLAFLVTLVLLARAWMTELGDKFSVGPAQATSLINHQNAVVFDVRPQADYDKGHIINAVAVPLSQLGTQIDKLNKYRKKPVIVSCRSGAQSLAACKQLRKAGFDPVYNLRGGILAWQSANLPVSKK
ncbi:MAG: rhodanese-like domain-containing protein [gamma proteobacterium symbiont of Bathyaustriella thionipta]|nr:rhodanese-like domain-containing protein [gamma proteobacterium symbiont of Bathyaustriella thionipta]